MRLLTGILSLVLLGCGAKIPQISTDGIESIDVTMYKSDFMGVEKDFNLAIPKEHWNAILDFTLPNKLTQAGPQELRIGTVKIKYKDKKLVSIDLFWVGKNPCMVSLDGKHFYYAKNIPGAPDGAVGLIRKVLAVREGKKP